MSPPQDKPRGGRTGRSHSATLGAAAAAQTVGSGSSRRVGCTTGRARARRLPQPAVASSVARARNQRTRRRIRHRVDLRQQPGAGTAGRHHRRGRRPAAGHHRPGTARPAAARDLSTAAHPRRRACRCLDHRRAGCHRIRFGASRFRQRRAAQDQHPRRAVLARRVGARPLGRPGGQRRVPACPPALGRTVIRRRAGRRRRRTRCGAGCRR